jgi:hypothetical protein
VTPWTTPQDCRDQFFRLFVSNCGPCNHGEQIKIQNMFGHCSLFAILDTYLGHIHVHVINEGAITTRVVQKARNSRAHNLIATPRSVSQHAIPVNSSSLIVHSFGSLGMVRASTVKRDRVMCPLLGDNFYLPTNGVIDLTIKCSSYRLRDI